MVVPKTATTTAAALESKRKRGLEGSQHHLSPGHVDSEHNRRIGQQREGEPLQITDVTMVGNKDLQQQRYDHKHRGHLQMGEACNEMGRFAHRHHISCNVEGIGE